MNIFTRKTLILNIWMIFRSIDLPPLLRCYFVELADLLSAINVCVCVCVFKRERERERERERVYFGLISYLGKIFYTLIAHKTFSA